MSESLPEFGDNLDGRVARMLHSFLRTVGILEEQIAQRDELIVELKRAVALRQAMLDALVPERKS